jgi:glycosyltransferase involved in cell wall biosynthesis
VPRVFSIITPSFNQGRFLQRAIDSVLSQDVPGWTIEYIVVDGGSRDQTCEVLGRYADRLRWISEPDRGQADAVNKGLRATRGELIGWLNSDDVYAPGALRTVGEFLDQHPEVDLVYGEAEYLDADDRVLGRYPTERFDAARLQHTCYLCQPAVFFRRRLVDRLGLLDERLHYTLDYEYWLRAAHAGARFAHVPDVLAGSRLHPGIKTYAGRLKLHQEMNWMMAERLGRVPDQWLYNYAHARLEPTRIDRTKHLRFALGLTAWTLWAALRWNHAIPSSVRRTTTIWLKDGLKLFAASLRAQASAALQ